MEHLEGKMPTSIYDNRALMDIQLVAVIRQEVAALRQAMQMLDT